MTIDDILNEFDTERTFRLRTFCYCDRCGKEIEHGTKTPYHLYSVYRHKHIELCQKCNDDLVKWIENCEDK